MHSELSTGWRDAGLRGFSDVFRWFVRANVAVSERLTPPFVHRTSAYARYEERGRELLEERPGRVLDVGAGRTWHFPAALKGPGTVLIGFDIDLAEMQGNVLLDRRISGDACESLQVPDGSIDLIMARAVIEHLHDTAAFLRNANRALRPGGRLIVTFASRHAPFAVLNRILPSRLSRWLLLRLVPGSDGVLGFKAYYDRASYGQFTKSLRAAGFGIEEAYASYFSCGYFRFFVPLFLASLAFDGVRHLAGIPAAASYFLFVAVKPEAGGEGAAAAAPGPGN